MHWWLGAGRGRRSRHRWRRGWWWRSAWLRNWRRRGRRTASLLLQPGLKVARRDGRDAEQHAAVSGAAQHGAYASKLAGLIGGVRDVVDAARVRVDLAPQIGYPEGVDDVHGRDVEHHLLADRQVQVVGGLDPRVAVAELPRELAPGDADVHHFRVRWNLAQLAEACHGNAEQADQNQGWHRGPHHLQARVAVDLWRLDGRQR